MGIILGALLPKFPEGRIGCTHRDVAFFLLKQNQRVNLWMGLVPPTPLISQALLLYEHNCSQHTVLDKKALYLTKKKKKKEKNGGRERKVIGKYNVPAETILYLFS